MSGRGASFAITVLFHEQFECPLAYALMPGPSSNDQVLLRELLARQHQERDPESDDAEFFELFVVEQYLKDRTLSYEELADGMTDGGGDGGIDAFYTFVNGVLIEEDTDLSVFRSDVTIEVAVFQAKSGFTEAAVMKIAATLADLLELDADLATKRSTYNESILARFSILHRTIKELADRSPRIRFSIVFGSPAVGVHPNVAGKVDLISNAVLGHFPSAHCGTEFLGASELIQLARVAPSDTQQLRILEGPLSSGQVGYVCLVKLSDFFAFLSLASGELNAGLFESNVRDYQGTTEVNEAIRISLETKGSEDFWWLNNGVSIVSTSANLTGKVFTLRDAQIVNGLQTSREIFEHLRTHPDEADDRSLLIRIVVPLDETSRNKIIRATNSQNSIPVASLRSTDQIHRDIEEYFGHRGLFYDRRKNFYKNEGKPRGQIVTIPYLAQAVAAVLLQRPSDARARPSSLLKSDTDYEQVFSTTYPIGTYYACVQLMRSTEHFLRVTDVGLSTSEKNDIKFHVGTVVAAMLIRSAKPSATQLAASSFDSVPDDVIRSAVGIVMDEILAMRDSESSLDLDRIAKSPELTQRIVQAISDKLAAMQTKDPP
jgi:hypothetical protein